MPWPPVRFPLVSRAGKAGRPSLSPVWPLVACRCLACMPRLSCLRSGHRGTNRGLAGVSCWQRSTVRPGMLSWHALGHVAGPRALAGRIVGEAQDVYTSRLRPNGGIGRRTGLKIPCPVRDMRVRVPLGHWETRGFLHFSTVSSWSRTSRVSEGMSESRTSCQAQAEQHPVRRSTDGGAPHKRRGWFFRQIAPLCLGVFQFFLPLPSIIRSLPVRVDFNEQLDDFNDLLLRTVRERIHSISTRNKRFPSKPRLAPNPAVRGPRPFPAVQALAWQAGSPSINITIPRASSGMSLQQSLELVANRHSFLEFTMLETVISILAQRRASDLHKRHSSSPAFGTNQLRS